MQLNSLNCLLIDETLPIALETTTLKEYSMFSDKLPIKLASCGARECVATSNNEL